MASIGMMTGVGSFQILAKDKFVDANGTLLTNHKMDLGGGWSVIGTQGNYTIQNNQATFSSATQTGDVSVNVAEPEASVQVDWVLGASQATASFSLGVYTRLIDISNYFFVGLNGAGTGNFSIATNFAGVFTTRASSTITLTGGNTYTIKASWGGQGNTLTASLSANAAATPLTYTDSTQNTAVLVGMDAGNDGVTAIVAANFLVTNP